MTKNHSRLLIEKAVDSLCEVDGFLKVGNLTEADHTLSEAFHLLHYARRHLRAELDKALFNNLTTIRVTQ